jgi:hypothetical protein
MAKRVGVDKWLFGVVLLLVLFGLVMVFSASAVMAQSTLGSPYPYVMKQAIWAVLGLLAMVLLMQVDYRRFNNPRVVFPAVAVTMLMLIGVFAVSGSHNTHRWVRFGDLFTFQPSELAKPVLVLFLAYFLQTRIHQMDDWKGTAGGCSAARVHSADFEGAGSGHGTGMHGGDCADVVPGGGAGEVLCDWSRAGLAGDVLHAVSREVPSRSHAGFSES